uniref:Neuronal acetylcholine receptor subunit alpha-6 n=1 Tax=Magallana gigas TaxID=29159 RepID=K1RBS8_MAGGI|eukprot:XP_011448925.1 PREDICTED: acetylcholine receptor subunit beta [Crassostrea gigas]
MNRFLLLLYFSFAFLLSGVDGSTPAQVNNLISTLLQGYDKRTRPVTDQDKAVKVDISFYLSIVNDIDEVAEKFVTTGWLHLSWTDQNLVWDSTTNNIYSIHLNQNDIWKPDIVLKNGFTKFKEMGGSFYYVSVDSSGYVSWYPYEVFETRCSIDITHFPYDKQTCKIVFIVWSYSVNQVEIEKSPNGVEYYEFEENSVWTILDTESIVNKDKYESEIIFKIELQRKPKYFVMNIILPVLCLSLLSLLVFLIPVDAGEKMGYSITVFLSFAVFLSIISAELPVNSESTSTLSFYLVLQMGVGTLVLVISAIQLRLHHRKTTADMSQIFRKMVKLDRCLRCKSGCCLSKKVQVRAIEKNEIEEQEIHTDDDIEWTDVTSAIDFFGFWLFFIFNIVVTSYLFISIISS